MHSKKRLDSERFKEAEANSTGFNTEELITPAKRVNVGDKPNTN
jgi:hypothetical protein